MDAKGQPLIGRLDIELTDSRDQEGQTAGLVKAQHLFAGSLLQYDGEWRLLGEATLNFEEEISAIKDEWISPTLSGQSTVFKKCTKEIIWRLKTEIILSQCLMRPCSAHYVMYGPSYLPYLKFRSRRAVAEGHFITKNCIDELIATLHGKIANRKASDEQALLYHALLNARLRATEWTKGQTETEQKPIEKTVEYSNGVTRQRIMFNGFTF